MDRLKSLDGMRGLLALCVAFNHLTFSKAVPGGYIAVDMFFIMSGFILCHAYAPSYGEMSLSKFFYKRIARLMPVYLVTGLVFIPMLVLGYPLEQQYVEGRPEEYAVTNFVTYVLAGQVVSPGFYWNTPGWSVSGELWLSPLVFMLLPWAMRKDTSPWPIIVLALSLYSVFIVLAGNLSAVSRGIVLSGTVFRPISGFLLGVGLYKLIGQNSLRLDVPAVLLALCELVLVLICFGLPLIVGRTPLDFLIIASFAALLWMLLVYDQKLILSRVLTTRPVVYLGAISFSVYLWHTLIKHFFLRGVRDGLFEIGMMQALAYLTVVVIISSFSLRLIELPGQRRLNRLFAAAPFAGEAAKRAILSAK